MEHTPGPWTWTNGEQPIDIKTYHSEGYFNNPQLVGALKQDVIGCDEYDILLGATNKERIANALLIAAAPELLAVCRTIYDGAAKLPDSVLCCIESVCGPDIARQLEAAIAKAEGK